MTRDQKPSGRRTLGRQGKIGNKPVRKTLRVFCEGKRTETDYLNGFKRKKSVKERAFVEIRVNRTDSGFVPMPLVERAVEARSRDKEGDREADEYWCVFDVEAPENHPKLSDAINLAEANDIKVAISNPCFELWLILHLRERNAELSTDAAKRLRHKCDGSDGDSVDPAAYLPHVGKAVARAVKLEARHKKNEDLLLRDKPPSYLADNPSFKRDNPSSGMHRLIASIQVPA